MVKENKMTHQKQFAVIYRTGGTENFRWNRVLNLFSREEASAQVAELELMGYPCLVHNAIKLDVIGLPETYD
jgi:hypothetical protein